LVIPMNKVRTVRATTEVGPDFELAYCRVRREEEKDDQQREEEQPMEACELNADGYCQLGSECAAVSLIASSHARPAGRIG
jgi:hypothetical protein